MIYAGIGSRKTPEYIKYLMTIIAYTLGDQHTLRSGGAIGADIAFETGASKKEIFVIEEDAEHPEYIVAPDLDTFPLMKDIAKEIHPNWSACVGKDSELLHARNVAQILGAGVDTPCDLVICWTPNGEIVGGTSTAITLAMRFEIPVLNLHNDSDLLSALSLLDKDEFMNNFIALLDTIPDQVQLDCIDKLQRSNFM